MQTFGLSEEQLNSILFSLNQHLKFEMNGHLNIESSCIDHCKTYNLSDPSTAAFNESCNHEHSTACDECGIVERTLFEISNVLDDPQLCLNIPSYILEEITFAISQSKTNILAWKAHCMGIFHQDYAKQNTVDNSQPNQALIVMDWAMKVLPIRHRESQSAFFGKKGISSHISSVVTCSLDSQPAYGPMEHAQNRFELHNFGHILQHGSQGWFSVAHIITDLIRQMQTFLPQVDEVLLKSDNAGCYHCSSLISFLFHLNTTSTVKVLEYNFSEPQAGTEMCDAKTAHCKMHILRFAREGHDIITPDDMLVAINSNGGINGVVASVVSVDQKQEIKAKTKVPNINLMNKITFLPEGVIFRKVY